MTARVLMIASRPPDPDGLGGVEVLLDTLLSRSTEAFAMFAAYPSAGELLVESGSPRTLCAALPLAEGARDRSGALADALEAALVGTRADVLHVHSPMLGSAALAEAARRTGVRTVLVLHNHSLVCENYELLEGGARYCGIPDDLGRCAACLEKTRGRPGFGVIDWRNAVQSLLDVTDALVAPSESVLDHAARLYPGVKARASKIPWGVPAPSARARASVLGGPLRLAVVGLFSIAKGRHRLPSLLAAARDVDAEWHLFGATEGDSLRDVRRAAPRVVVHGAYPRRELGERLVEAGCHVAVLPSIFPESFSLTLSEITSAGIPVVASNLGALSERVTGEALGWTFDPWDEAGFAELVRSLERNRGEVDRVAARLRSRERRTEEDMILDHERLWASLAAMPRREGSGAAAAARTRFDEAARVVARRRPSLVGHAVERIRKTDFYRDLPLRRLLSVSTRKRVEAVLARLSSRVGRR